MNQLNTPKAFVLLCLSAAIVVLTGCNTVRVTGTLKVPAEVNMAGRDRVILQTIQGQGGQLITARLKPALVAAQFKVLDRQSLGTAVREQELEALGVADAVERQKIMTAGVLIRGNTVRHAFDQSFQEGQQTVVRDGVKYPVPVYQGVGQATVEVAFDVVDLSTSEIIAPKYVAITKVAKTEWSTSRQRVSPEPIFNQCYGAVVDQFMKAISAHDVIVQDVLYKNSKLTENTSGIGMFLAPDYAQAAKDFEAALDSAKALPKITPAQLSQVWHNLGLAYEFGLQYQKAIDCYKQSLGLKPSVATQQSLARCQKRVENEGRLRDQGQTITRK